MSKIYIGARGNPSAKIFILGEKVGFYEEQKKELFAGPTGKLFYEICRDAGLDSNSCFVSNVIPYNVPTVKPKELRDDYGISLEECIKRVHDEIREIKPNIILALGNLAMQACIGEKTGINKWRGSVLQANFQIKASDGTLYRPKVLCTIHPAAFLWSKDRPKNQGTAWSMKPIVTLDFKRAKEQSAFRDYRPPERTLEVCRSYPQFKAFLDKYKDRAKYPFCASDIETIKCIPICISFAFTPKHAIAVPLMNLNPIEFSPQELARIWFEIAELYEDPELKHIGQNFKFDHEKLERPCGFRIPKLYADTSFMMRWVYPELRVNLALSTSIFTEEPFYKDDGKEFNIKKDNIERFLIYNAKDSAVTLEIFFALYDLITKYNLNPFFEKMMPMHHFYMRMERIGFALDLERRKQLLEKYNLWAHEIHNELNILTQLNCQCNLVGRCVYNSVKEMRKLLFETHGVPERTKIDEDSLCAILSNARLNYLVRSIVEGIYKYRRVRKAKKSIEALPDYDGRMRTSVRAAGTETGRRSNSVLKPPLRPTQVGIVAQTLTKHGEYGPDIREQFIADPGHVYVQVDSSQAEARIVALLAEDYELLNSFGKIDVHKMTASWFFDKPMEEITDDERFVGKTGRHAGNYGMGKHRLALDITSGARRFNIKSQRTGQLLVISEALANQLLLKFHKNSSRIRGVFHEQVRKFLKDNRRVLVNPFGRRRLFMDRWGDSLFREAFAQIPQSTVGDNTLLALLRAEQRFIEMGIKVHFVSESHDSGLVMTLEENKWVVAKVIKEEFEKPIDFGPCTISRGTLSIPADVEMGTNYRFLKKVKEWPANLSI